MKLLCGSSLKMLGNVLRRESVERQQNLARLCWLRAKTTAAKNQEEPGGSLQSNPYFAKYQAKLNRLKQDDPFIYAEKMGNLVEPKQKGSEPQSEDNVRLDSLVASDKEIELTSGQSRRVNKELKDILRLDKIADLQVDEIKQLWTEHHMKKDCLSGFVEGSRFDDIKNLVSKFPLFVYPLPKTSGFELFFCQAHFPSLYFTPLAQYKLHSENAPICLSVHHFEDLIGSKGLVLMSGEYDSTVLQPHEAQNLLNQFQLFYNSAEPAKLSLVRMFNENPQMFDYNQLLNNIPGFKT